MDRALAEGRPARSQRRSWPGPTWRAQARSSHPPSCPRSGPRSMPSSSSIAVEHLRVADRIVGSAAGGEGDSPWPGRSTKQESAPCRKGHRPQGANGCACRPCRGSDGSGSPSPPVHRNPCDRLRRHVAPGTFLRIEIVENPHRAIRADKARWTGLPLVRESRWQSTSRHGDGRARGRDGLICELPGGARAMARVERPRLGGRGFALRHLEELRGTREEIRGLLRPRQRAKRSRGGRCGNQRRQCRGASVSPTSNRQDGSDS